MDYATCVLKLKAPEPEVELAETVMSSSEIPPGAILAEVAVPLSAEYVTVVPLGRVAPAAV